MQQTFYDFKALEILKDKRPLLVCDGSFDLFEIEIPCEFTRFSGFQPNPLYEEAKAGVKVLRENKCDFIIAVGGGSCIDVAKSIKYYNRAVDINIMAVPTTSGTGSEATHFAVIYKKGEKYSVADESLLPDYVILQPEMLKTLPLYQKKCTMLDALCQAIESWWSKSATPLSVSYSRKAIEMILDNMQGYLKNEDIGNKNMLIASNYAGKAINITTTTAPHAMSYKLTSLYNLAHGHAVALCLPKVWRYMKNFDKLGEIANAMGKQNSDEAVLYFEQLLEMLEIFPPRDINADDIADDLDILTNSVNAQRLKNNPARLDKDTIKNLYKDILEILEV